MVLLTSLYFFICSLSFLSTGFRIAGGRNIGGKKTIPKVYFFKMVIIRLQIKGWIRISDEFCRYMYTAKKVMEASVTKLYTTYIFEVYLETFLGLEVYLETFLGFCFSNKQKNLEMFRIPWKHPCIHFPETSITFSLCTVLCTVRGHATISLPYFIFCILAYSKGEYWWAHHQCSRHASTVCMQLS